MEEGNFRCEPNLSLRPRGSEEFGSKVELKNLNSFRAALRGTEFEVERQTKLLNEGKKVVSETRGWRDDTQETASQRSKEEAHDYRYFPEPDLPPIAVSREWVEEIRGSLPELPDARRARFVSEYGLTDYEANLLTESRAKADYYETSLSLLGSPEAANAKLVSNWLLGDLSRLLNDSGLELDSADLKLGSEAFAQLLRLLQAGTITNSTAKEVLRSAFETGAEPESIVTEKGLGAMENDGELAAIVRKIIADNAKIVAEYRGGKSGAINALLGLVMKETSGRANAGEVRSLLQAELDQAS
jgi:aspartyl-tRNA(Asn)/glutamyl-tRNA(Gln) amidotransferase subunit B